MQRPNSARFVGSREINRVQPACQKSKKRWPAIALAAGAVSFCIIRPACATTTDTWIGLSTSWSNPAAWSSGVPVTSGEFVNIINSDNNARTITYDYSLAPVTLGNFTIDLTGGGNFDTLSMSAHALTAATETIGNAGNGAINQTGGTNTVNTNLYLGNSSTGIGNYTLGNNAGLSISSNAYVGYSGAGTFSQTGGTNTVGGNLYLGENSTGTGSYTLASNASLIVPTEYIGDSGTGTFNQTGGTNAVSSYLEIGSAGGSTGAYTLGVGATLSAANEWVGAVGTGSFNQTGGTNTVSGLLQLGIISSGSYSLGTGALLSAQIEFVGSDGAGTFNQTGGTNTVSNEFDVADGPGTTGSYTLAASARLSAPTENIGASGIGVFSQTGGTNTVATQLFVGENAIGTGSYTLGSNASLTAPNESIGDFGTGAFNQTGGTNTVNNEIDLGEVPSGTGSYTLAAGASLSALTENVGESGVGTFTQTGGTNTASFELNLGYLANSKGSYTLAAGATLLTGGESVGFNGTGIFNQTGGTNNLGSQELDIASGSSLSVGTYTLASGASLAAGSENIGEGGNATFIQTGGTNSTNFFECAYAGSTGNYTLGVGASLLVSGMGAEEIVGYQGNGTFTQNGGTNTITTKLDIGLDAANAPLMQPAGIGIYIMASGTTLSTATEVIGDGGTGTFSQTGGTNTVSISLTLGSQSNSTGSYTLATGATLSAATEIIGNSGAGTFTQTGGTNTVTSEFDIAESSNPSNYSASNGTLNVNGNAYIGGSAANANLSGVGTLAVSGNAVANLSGTLKVFNNFGNLVTLSGGTLNVGVLDLSGNTALLNWTAGTLNLTNTNLVFDPTLAGAPNAPFGGSLTLSSTQALLVSNGTETLDGAAGGSGAGGGGASLTLNSSLNTISGNAFIQPTASLTLNGIATFIVGAGGGTLINNGTINWNGGVISGRLINQTGTVNFGPGAFVTASNGVENDAIMSLAANQTLFVNGAGLDNLGFFTLAGGTLNGTGAVLNDYSGSMSAYGTIQQGFNNDGIFNINGVLNINAASTNNATINVSTGGLLRGSSLTNAASGIIQGNGAVTMTGTTNSGLIFANGYAGPLTIIGLNSNGGGGELRVAYGDTLNMTTAFSNAGLINLQGVNSTLTGGNVTNTGTIQGTGRISNTVLNSGAISPTGGQLILAGAGNTNTSLGQIQVASGNTLSVTQGVATNAGVIALTGGTFDNNNVAMTNTAAAYIAGSGTLKTGGLTNQGFLNVGGNFSAFGAVTNSASGAINVTGAGLNAFYGPVTNNGAINVAPGASVTFFNSFSGTSPVNNNGTVTLESISNSGPIVGVGELVIGSGAATSLTLNAGSGVSKQSAVIFNAGSTLDLTNNGIVIAYGAAANQASTDAAMLAYLSNASYNENTQSGTSIISSSLATNIKYAIGEVDGNDGISGSPVAVDTLELAYTLKGDVNLDGIVNGTDFSILVTHFGQPITGIGWEQGDVTGDGIINGSDFSALVTNFGAPNNSAAFSNSTGGGLVTVPEPATTGLLLLCGLGMLSRRKRHRAK